MVDWDRYTKEVTFLERDVEVLVALDKSFNADKKSVAGQWQYLAQLKDSELREFGLHNIIKEASAARALTIPNRVSNYVRNQIIIDVLEPLNTDVDSKVVEYLKNPSDKRRAEESNLAVFKLWTQATLIQKENNGEIAAQINNYLRAKAKEIRNLHKKTPGAILKEVPQKSWDEHIDIVANLKADIRNNQYNAFGRMHADADESFDYMAKILGTTKESLFSKTREAVVGLPQVVVATASGQQVYTSDDERQKHTRSPPMFGTEGI